MLKRLKLFMMWLCYDENYEKYIIIDDTISFENKSQLPVYTTDYYEYH